MSALRYLVAAGSALITFSALADEPRVVADTPIAHSMVAMIMGPDAAPELLLERGADPHNFQLHPSQARALARADLVIWTSPLLSPWMARPIDSLVNAVVLDLAQVDGVRLQDFAPNSLLPGTQNEAQHDDDHGHEHADYDPHLWLDPQNAAPMLRAIAAQLSVLDPDNTTFYVENSQTAISAMDGVRDDVAQTLAPVADAGLILHHDAYGYFATAFGLNVLGTITEGDAADPGAARLHMLRAAMADAGAVCLFPEVNHPSNLARVVAEGSPIRIGAALDPEGVAVDPGPELYSQVLRNLARAIADCVLTR